MAKDRPWRRAPSNLTVPARRRGQRHPSLAGGVRLVVVVALFGSTLSWQGVSAKTMGRAARNQVVRRSLAPPAPLGQTTEARTVDGGLAITTTFTRAQAALGTGTIALEVFGANGQRVGRRLFAGMILVHGQRVRRSFWWPAPISGRYRVAIRVLTPDGSANLLWVPQAAVVAVVATGRVRGSSELPPSSATSTATASLTATSIATATPTVTAGVAAAPTLIPTAPWLHSGPRPRLATATGTPTATATGTPTATAAATASPTSTATATDSTTATSTPTSTATATPTATAPDTATPPPFSGVLTDRTTTGPGSISSGGPVAITAVITDRGSALGNGIIDIEVYNAHDARVGQQAFPGQTIQPGQSASVTYAWPGGASGFYRVTVGVFAVGWSSLLLWNDSAAFFGVGDTSVSFNQSTTVSGTARVSITTTITDTSGTLVGSILDIEVHGADGAQLNQQSFPGQNFTPGQAVTRTVTWTPSGAGSYYVTVGVFSPWWVATLFWDNSAAPITIGP